MPTGDGGPEQGGFQGDSRVTRNPRQTASPTAASSCVPDFFLKTFFNFFTYYFSETFPIFVPETNNKETMEKKIKILKVRHDDPNYVTLLLAYTGEHPEREILEDALRKYNSIFDEEYPKREDDMKALLDDIIRDEYAHYDGDIYSVEEVDMNRDLSDWKVYLEYVNEQFREFHKCQVEVRPIEPDPEGRLIAEGYYDVLILRNGKIAEVIQTEVSEAELRSEIRKAKKYIQNMFRP